MPQVDNIWEFTIALDEFYSKNKREMAWREPASDGTFDPYKILVSEIMLQQTQVSRVAVYFDRFILKFPTIKALAEADLASVFLEWQGLGYNRRARYLREAARKVMADFGGLMPDNESDLTLLPGVGKNTAGAIMAYAYNKPAIFIETNIRTVYIHHFFEGQEKVSDQDILRLLDRTINKDHPREFYWALMDYGTYLKTTTKNLNQRSAGYTKQSVFEGSHRQIRGRVLHLLATGPKHNETVVNLIDDHRLDTVINDLKKEKLISESHGQLFIAL